MKKATRSSDVNPILGFPEQLSGRNLPTCEEVLRFFKFVEKEKKEESNGYDPSAQAIAQVVADRVEEVWLAASVPTVSNRSILLAVMRLHLQFTKVMKNVKRDANKPDSPSARFRSDAQRLFDVAPCKCLPRRAGCICDQRLTGTEDFLPFLVDQRTERRMAVGGVDFKATREAIAALQKLMAREEQKKVEADAAAEKAEANNFISSLRSKLESLCTKAAIAEDDDVDVPLPPLSDDEWTPTPCLSSSGSSSRPSSGCSSRPSSACSARNLAELPNTCKMVERFNLPSGAAAALVTAVLQDNGQVSSDDTSLVVDRKKISRQRQKYRGLATEQDLQKLREAPVVAVYFDGRIDWTKEREVLFNKVRIREVKEEHVVVLAEPGCQYIGHCSPETSDGKCLGNSVVDCVEAAAIDTSCWRCVGGDGCATNVGWKGGAMRVIEVRLGRPLQRCVCQLHGNELPLKHVMEVFDGPTTGPKTWSGPIGRQLETCCELPVVKFEKIALDLPDEDLDSSLLSTSQKYTLDMARGIASGHVSPELAARDPGELDPGRWGSTGNRVMRVYVGTRRPPAALKHITAVIMKVYIPLWFRIKKYPKITEGAKHVYETIVRLRSIPKKYRDVMEEYVQNNAHFAHPENVLLSMVTDERPAVRRLGIQRVVDARRLHKDDHEIRAFHVPNLNFSAVDYTDIIDWDSLIITPPPLLDDIQTEDLEAMLLDTSEGSPPVIAVPDLPCHTQAVERHIKMVTEASRLMTTAEDRDGNIRQKIGSRKLMPKFASKKDFKCT